MSVNELEKNELNNENDKEDEIKEKPDCKTEEIKDQTTKNEAEEKIEESTDNLTVESEEEATDESEEEATDESKEEATDESEEDIIDKSTEETDEENEESAEEEMAEEEEKLYTPGGEDFEDDTTAVDRVFGDDGKDEKKNGSFARGLFEILEMLGIAIAVVVLIITFFFRFSNVDGESMTYTINEKDTLLVSMAFYEPKKGDVIIFQAPDYDLNKPLVKRVIATEGDTLEINFDTWEVKVNGVTLDEDYVRYHPYLPKGEDKLYVQNYPDWDMDTQSIGGIEEGSYDPVAKIFKATIPEGHVFAMGDNRNNSHDSRSADIGMVDERYIIGKVICRLFPFENFGAID